MKKSLILAVALLFASQAHASLQELIQGVKDNNQEKVLQLLNSGENVNAVNELGNSALHYAVALNNAEMTKILLEHGADMNISNAKGWSPLGIVEKKKVEDVAAVVFAAKKAAEEKVVTPVQEVAAAAEDAVTAVPAAAEKVANEVPAAVEKVVNEVPAAVETAPEALEVVTTTIIEKVTEPAETIESKETIESGDIIESEETAAIEETAEALPATVTTVTKTVVTEETVAAPKNEEVPAEVIDSMVKESAAKPETPEVVAPVKAQNPEQSSNLTAEDTEKLFILIDQAKLALIQAKQAQEKATLQNAELQMQLQRLQAKNDILSERLAKYEAAEREAEVAKAKAEQEAKEKAEKAAKEAAERKALLEKNAPKPVAKKPAYKPRVSDMEKGLYVGDEEIVYCLSYLGNGENSGMRRASAHFAASAGINEARYNQIAQMADSYFQSADMTALQNRSNECAAVITPANVAKQNQIIRSLNSSVGDIIIIR